MTPSQAFTPDHISAVLEEARSHITTSGGKKTPGVLNRRDLVAIIEQLQGQIRDAVRTSVSLRSYYAIPEESIHQLRALVSEEKTEDTTSVRDILVTVHPGVEVIGRLLLSPRQDTKESPHAQTIFHLVFEGKNTYRPLHFSAVLVPAKGWTPSDVMVADVQFIVETRVTTFFAGPTGGRNAMQHAPMSLAEWEGMLLNSSVSINGDKAIGTVVKVEKV